MKLNELTKNIVVLLIIFSVGFGCRFFQLTKEPEIPKEIPSTKITKDILKERLGKKGIESLPIQTPEENAAVKTNSSADQDTLKKSRDKDDIRKDDIRDVQEYIPKGPNPLYLGLRFLEPGDTPKTRLNNEDYKYDELIKTLKSVFAEREKNGVFKNGTNEVEKEITLMATDADIDFYNSHNINVEWFENWVDNLRKEGIEQIRLDFNEPIIPKNSNKTKTQTTSGELKPISSGIVNEKAINLVKSIYPPAAKAVRASGAVNVQVLIDEEGNV